MKNIIKILLLLSLTSCNTSKLLQLGCDASKQGLEVSQKGIDTYTILGEQKDVDESQRDMVKILTNPDPAKMPMPHTVSRDFSKELEPRIKAYQSLLNVYQAFSLLTDSKYSSDTQAASAAVLASYNSIKKLPHLSSTVSSAVADVSGMITQSIQAKAVKKHNEILYNLTKVYLDLWNDEVSTWDEYIDSIYNTYAGGLNTVPAKYYDMAKVKSSSALPYDDDILLLVYRINQRTAINKQKNDLKQQLADFGKALTQLNQAHAALSKEQTNVSDVTTYLSNISNLLKAK